MKQTKFVPRQPKMTAEEAYDELLSEGWMQALINRELISRMFGPEALGRLLEGATSGPEVERRLVESLLDMEARQLAA